MKHFRVFDVTVTDPREGKIAQLVSPRVKRIPPQEIYEFYQCFSDSA